MSDEEQFEFSDDDGELDSARDRLRQGYEQNGAVVCTACDTEIDLTGASDLEDAAARWNDHVQAEHPGEVSDR